MKRKIYTIFALVALFTFSGLIGQEMIVGGDMESADAWTVYEQDPAPAYEFGYTVDGPSAGSDGCFHMNYTGQYCQVLIFQELTLKAGVEYTVTGAFKGVTDSFWGELLIGTSVPIEGIDWKPKYGEDNVDAVAYGFNTWGGDTWDGCGENVDGTFQDDACQVLLPSPYVPAGDAGSDVVVYFGVKSGVYNFDVDAVSMDVMLDNLSMVGRNVAVNENITSSFTCYPVPAKDMLHFEGTDLEGALQALENVRARAGQSYFQMNDENVQLPTFSAGLVSYIEDETPDEFVHRADQYLYKAKSSGRNCIESESEPEIENREELSH